MGPSVSLNALKAFESAARHLSFTVAADELSVTPAAISHQVKSLEDRLGVRLFRRTSRGLVITDEGLALVPTLSETFARLGRLLEQFEHGHRREVLTVSVVGTFAMGWLLPRLQAFEARHPMVDLRLLTNNNRVDVAGESLDFAIRFGDGAWHGLQAERLLDAPLSPLCSPAMAAPLRTPADLKDLPLLRSYRPQDWPAWFEAAGCAPVPLRGPVFDASTLMAQAAIDGHGVALVPPRMFAREIESGRLVQPFPIAVSTGAYWLTMLKSRPVTPAMSAFRRWLLAEGPGA
ncbi:LysR family transcriptional regulator [Pseudoxanthomonas winnipegensis]|uniref:LysR family transcriptional regulator n=1 Tax=Pseudoxanthomonas winnipegensis TaxID=2480810 RepID=A0A4Q8LG84_9GAMM|nr:LysR family transcriptional regulator [Pseudoxanthomonas winnipegensis]